MKIVAAWKMPIGMLALSILFLSWALFGWLPTFGAPTIVGASAVDMHGRKATSTPLPSILAFYAPSSDVSKPVLPVATVAPVVAPECLPWRMITGPNPSTLVNWLFGVAAVAHDEAWAVGAYWGPGGAGQTLAAHWEDEGWRQVPSPNDTENNTLQGVSGTASDDVWAVGYHGPPFGERMLTMHWDGANWQLIPTPIIDTADYLYGVAAVSTDNVWAVGYSTSTGSARTLVIHWDGTQWAMMPAPNPNIYNGLVSIAVVSANDIWAVGNTLNSGNVLESLTLHWDGLEWTRIPSPSPGNSYNYLRSIATITSDDVWAVGYYGSDPSLAKALILHWDGTGWQLIPSPGIDGFNNYLLGVAAISSGNVWAVGSYGMTMDHDERALTLHWDGSRWGIEESPNVGTTEARLQAIAANPMGELWSVGYKNNPGLVGWAHTLTEHHLDPCTPCAIEFTDVQATDYFFAGVQYMYCRSIVVGYPDSTFRPYSNTTRAQLSKIVVLAEGWPIYLPLSPSFTDVTDDSSFYPYVETARYHGVVSGYSDGTFRPGNDVTRGQASKMIVHARGWQIDTSGGPHFADVPVDFSFYQYIETAYNHGIITGYDDYTFRPGASATRGQLAKVVFNAIASPEGSDPSK